MRVIDLRQYLVEVEIGPGMVIDTGIARPGPDDSPGLRRESGIDGPIGSQTPPATELLDFDAPPEAPDQTGKGRSQGERDDQPEGIQ